MANSFWAVRSNARPSQINSEEAPIEMTVSARDRVPPRLLTVFLNFSLSCQLLNHKCCGLWTLVSKILEKLHFLVGVSSPHAFPGLQEQFQGQLLGGHPLL